MTAWLTSSASGVSTGVRRQPAPNSRKPVIPAIAIDLSAALIHVDNRLAQTAYPWNFPCFKQKNSVVRAVSPLAQNDPAFVVFALYQGTTSVVPLQAQIDQGFSPCQR